MNAQAARALYAAEAAGVKQIKYALHEPSTGGFCAGGVLINVLLGRLGGRWKGACPSVYVGREVESVFGVDAEEWSRIVKLNNFDGLTFGEIARKLGPDSV